VLQHFFSAVRIDLNYASHSQMAFCFYHLECFETSLCLLVLELLSNSLIELIDNLSPPGWQNIALMSYYGNQSSQVLLKNDHINFQLNSPFNNIFLTYERFYWLKVYTKKISKLNFC
jgi:hypothetical protein